VRPRTTIAALLIAASAAYLGVRFGPKAFPRKPDVFALNPDQKQRLKQARAAYAAYPSITFTESTTIADIRAVLDAAPDQPVPPATPQIPATLTPEQARRHRAELSRLMAEFLLYAVYKDDADTYTAWRLGRGDRLMTMEEMKRFHYIGDAWLEFTGQPMPETATSEQSFRLMAEHHADNAPPERRIVGILDHPNAAFTQLWFTNPHLSVEVPDPEPLGPLWGGSTVGTFLSFFTAGVNRDDLYARTQPTLRARTGVILIDAGGLHHPIFLGAFWDPSRNNSQGNWIIDYLNVGNHDPDHPLWFYF